MNKFLQSACEKFVLLAFVSMFAVGLVYIVLGIIDICWQIDLIDELSNVLVIMYLLCLANMLMSLLLHYLRELIYGASTLNRLPAW